MDPAVSTGGAEGALPLRIATQVPITTAEGPGRRFAVWVQGCDLACPGCCNPRMFAREGGRRVTVDAVLRTLDEARAAHGIEGITVLGGEPLQQRAGVTALCRGARARGLGVIVFTGYRREDVRDTPGFASLWACVDTLVDGRYDATQPEPTPEAGGRRFIGSRNQRLWHRTDRYRDPALWHGAPRLEVHVDAAGEISAHGEPGLVRDLLRALRHGPAAV